jgi:hypothetical protein
MDILDNPTSIFGGGLYILIPNIGAGLTGRSFIPIVYLLHRGGRRFESDSAHRGIPRNGEFLFKRQPACGNQAVPYQIIGTKGSYSIVNPPSRMGFKLLAINQKAKMNNKKSSLALLLLSHCVR